MKQFKFLFLFISLLAFSLFTVHSNTPGLITNANTSIRTATTHDVHHIFTLSAFDLIGAQYFTTEGNETITLSPEVVRTYLREEDSCNNVSSWGTHTNHENLATYAGRSNILHLNGTIIPDLAATVDRSETRLWNNETFTMVCYVNSSFPLTSNHKIDINIYDNDDKMEVLASFLAKNATAMTFYQYGSASFVGRDIPYNHWTTIAFRINTTAQNYTVYIDGAYLGQRDFRVATRANMGESQLSAIEANVWVDSFSWNTTISTNEFSTGSYVSPILDLGDANNWFYDAVAFCINAPSDSGIALSAYLEGIGWAPIASNQSLGYEISRYLQLMVNLTASSDLLDTPSFFWLQLNWTETVTDPPPSSPPQAISKYIGVTFFFAVVVVFLSICFSSKKGK